MNEIRLVKKAKKGNKEALLQLVMTEKDAYYKLTFTYLDAIEVICMDQIEKQLLEGKKHMDSIKAPEELEDRLRNALHTTPKRSKRKISSWAMVAVSLCIIILISYQYDAFAYYGKKLFGFDEIISGTLKDLNNEGMGQTIGKKTTLVDGTSLTIDGIMTDENQVVLYYTLSNPDGFIDFYSVIYSPFSITGFLTKSHHVSGTSILNEERTEIKGVDTFESVNPFSKKLTLNYRQDLQGGNGQKIVFHFLISQIKQCRL